MDSNLPTAADYANHNANEALDKYKLLEKRVRILEQRLNIISRFLKIGGE